MEQKPVAGQVPMLPPGPDIAQAYLDEAAVVSVRRESQLDRRRAARLSILDALVTALYVTTLMFSFGLPSTGMFFALVPFVMMWSFLMNQRRESLGFVNKGIGMSRTMTVWFIVILGASMLGGFALMVLEVPIPFWARLLPGALILLVIGGAAVRELQLSPPARPLRDVPEFTVAARWMTLGLGLALSLGLWTLSTRDEVLISGVGVFVVLVVGGFFTVGLASERVPSLGAVWGVFQWAAFAGVGLASLLAIMILPRSGTGPNGFGYVAAACAVLFVVAAFARGRRAN